MTSRPCRPVGSAEILALAIVWERAILAGCDPDGDLVKQDEAMEMAEDALHRALDTRPEVHAPTYVPPIPLLMSLSPPPTAPPPAPPTPTPPPPPTPTT